MEITTVLFIMGFIIIAGLIAQYLFRKLKIPDVLLLVLVGIALSLNGAVAGVKDASYMEFVITLSLIYVIFDGALPIRLGALFSSMKYAFASSTINFVLITAVIGTITTFFGFSPLMAFSLAALFAVIDGPILHSLFGVIKMSDKATAQLHTESALTEIFAIVGVTAALNFSRIGVENIIQSLASYIIMSFAIGLIVAVVWAFVLRHVGSYSSSSVATMALLVILYAISEYLGGNGVVAVFAFSIVLGNVNTWSKFLKEKQKESISVLDLNTKSFFRDLSFLIRTFLFVYLGTLIDLDQWYFMLLGFGFFIIAYLIRSAILKFIANKGLKGKDVYFINSMCAKGLTSVVILALIGGTSAFTNIVIGGVLSSVIITSVLVYLIDKDKFTKLY